MRKTNLKPRIRPFRGVTRLPVDVNEEFSAYLDFIKSMGYLVYEDPTSEGQLIFISSKVLTYGWLKKAANRFLIDLPWWNDQTYFNQRLKEELEKY